MKWLESIKTLSRKANETKTGIKRFVKDPLMVIGLAGIGGISGVAGCAYGPPDPVCSRGERYCTDDYAMICYGAYSEENNDWYGLECEVGCSEGACIDNKVKNEIVTDCEFGETKSENEETKVCIDGVWFNRNY